MEKLNKNRKDISREIVLFWLNLFHIKVSDDVEHLLVQIFKFGIVGVVATLIDFVFLYIFRDLCRWPLLISNTLSFCISVIYNYFASLTFVFDVNKEKSQKRTFVIFIICSVLGLLLNDLIVYVITDILGIYYMLSKLFATLVVMIFNFITRKKFLE